MYCPPSRSRLVAWPWCPRLSVRDEVRDGCCAARPASLLPMLRGRRRVALVAGDEPPTHFPWPDIWVTCGSLRMLGATIRASAMTVRFHLSIELRRQ